MSRTIDATFDGSVFHPAQPVDLKPNTRVRIIVEDEPETRGDCGTPTDCCYSPVFSTSSRIGTVTVRPAAETD